MYHTPVRLDAGYPHPVRAKPFDLLVDHHGHAASARGPLETACGEIRIGVAGVRLIADRVDTCQVQQRVEFQSFPVRNGVGFRERLLHPQIRVELVARRPFVRQDEITGSNEAALG